jgi:hypothetical protein
VHLYLPLDRGGRCGILGLTKQLGVEIGHKPRQKNEDNENDRDGLLFASSCHRYLLQMRHFLIIIISKKCSFGKRKRAKKRKIRKKEENMRINSNKI